jgi:hypothetical protein
MMPDAKIAFIDPHAALGPLTATIVAGLGPSAPHTDDEPEKVEPISARLMTGPALRLGASGGAELHYTQILDQIWAEFDDPEERTAARLRAVLEEVADEAQRVFSLAQETWPKLSKFKVPDSERARYDREFLAYLRRLNGYRDMLQELEPSSTATESVYVGLIQRRQGAGPVPDCIMHMYFAEQLGILAEHADEMGEGFIGRVLGGLERIDTLIDNANNIIEDIGDRVTEDAASAWDQFTRGVKWAAAIFVGSIVVIAGTAVTVAVIRSRSAKQPEQPKELQP